MNKSMLVAIFLSLGLLAWVLSGSDQTSGETQQFTEEIQPMKVQVTASEAKEVDIQILFQGELLPAREVTLRAETDGRIESIIVDKAQGVTRDQLILKLALDDRSARLAGAKAELIKAESDLDSNRKLFKRGLLSASQLKQDEAKYATAQAQVSQINNEIRNTLIKAPFDSIVDDRFVEIGDFVREGDALVRVLDTNKLKVVGWVPQQKASDLELGQSVSTELVNGLKLTGTVKYVAPRANTETRAFKVEVEIIPEKKVKLLGSSVSSKIVTQRQKAHFLSPAVISLDSNGDLLVKVVNQQNQVESYPVEVVQSESSGVWLTGLPDNANVITMGQGFVLDNQVVVPTFVKPDAEVTHTKPESVKHEA